MVERWKKEEMNGRKRRREEEMSGECRLEKGIRGIRFISGEYSKEIASLRSR